MLWRTSFFWFRLCGATHDFFWWFLRAEYVVVRKLPPGGSITATQTLPRSKNCNVRAFRSCSRRRRSYNSSLQEGKFLLRRLFIKAPGPGVPLARPPPAVPLAAAVLERSPPTRMIGTQKSLQKEEKDKRRRRCAPQNSVRRVPPPPAALLVPPRPAVPLAVLLCAARAVLEG